MARRGRKSRKASGSAGRIGIEMKRYVIGFMFDETIKHVVLIRKNRPDWQAGKLNGIGGHIEPGEFPIDAMVREFHEETGAKTKISTWVHVLTLRFPYAELEVFAAKDGHILSGVKSITDETVIKFYLAGQHFSPEEMVENVPAMLALAAQRLVDREGFAPDGRAVK